MATYIAHSVIGVIAVNEQGKPVSFIPFGGDAKKRADGIEGCQKRNLSDSEKKLKDMIKSNDLVFEAKKEGYGHEFPNPAGEYLRANLLEVAKNSGVAKTKADINRIIHDTGLEMAVRLMRVSIGEDKLLLQAINTTDELSKQVNTMAMRLREWYGYYFPEVVEKTQDNERLAEYVSETLYRSDVKGIDAGESMGADLKKEDLEEIRKYAKKIISVAEEKKELEKYIEKKAKEIAPTMTEIVGGMLVARLVAHAGTLEKLAGFPSSTIQILGAEKALFRYLKGTGTSPKHGIIFQNQYIQRAPKQSRGKLARTLASKLSLAAKMDFYRRGGDFGKKYRADMEVVLKKELSRKPKGSRFDSGKKFDRNKKAGNKHFGRRKNK